MIAVVDGVAELRNRFARDGCVEFRVTYAKAISQALLVAGGMGAVVVVAWIYGPLFGVPATLLGVWLVGGLALLWLDQVFGAGPALRVDREGVTLRRWRQPLVLPWSDVCSVLPRQSVGNPAGPGARPNNRVGPQVAVLMSAWVWHDYRESRPKALALADRITNFKGRYLVLLKVLDASAQEILDFLDAKMLDSLTRFEPPLRLVLDLSEKGEGPLWLRGGREAALDKLPLSPSVLHEVREWDRRMTRIATGELPPPEAHSLLQETRNLARQIEQDLGPGSEVLGAPDVPQSGG